MKKINLLQYLAFTPILFVLMSFLWLSSPVLVSAQNNTNTTGGEASGQNTTGGSANGQSTTGGVTDSTQKVELLNPLKVGSLSDLLIAILNIVIILMVPIIVFFIIYAGFRYVMAQGNASQVEEATKSLTYAVIGGVLILGAVAIAEIIKNLVNAFAATP